MIFIRTLQYLWAKFRISTRFALILIVALAYMSAPGAKADTAICPDGSHLSAGLCVSDTVSATPLTVSSTEACPPTLPGQTAVLNSTTHQCAMSQISVPATAGTTYSCPSGGLLGGTSGAWGSNTTTCYVNAIVLNAVGTSGYSCPGGGTPTASGTAGVYDTCVTDTTVSSYLNTDLIVAYNCSSGTPTLISGLHKCITSSAVYGAPPTVTSTPICPVNTSLVNGSCQSFGITSYPATPVAIYVCPSGGKLSGNLCIIGAYASIYNATQVGVQYTCPSGGSPSADLVQLCQTTGATTSIPPQYNSVSTCATGTLSSDGQNCITTAQTVIDATTTTNYGQCASPAHNADPYCITTTHTVVSATYSTTYSCPSGTPSGSGYSMLCTISTASSYSATPNGVSDTSGFTGGTLTHSSGYYYRTFTTSGTLGGITSSSPPVDIFVLGGGGAGWGASCACASGGGAGASVVISSNLTLSGSSQSVVVGAGGANTYTDMGNAGQASSFDGVTGAGGAGGLYNGSATSVDGTGNGAWGGPAGNGNNSYGTWLTATNTGVSGYIGAGGGYWWSSSSAPGGTGGGNNGTGNGVANTGAGGTGRPQNAGYSGGSGLVIIRWPETSTLTYFCNTGTLSGTGSGSICITTNATTVPSVFTYTGTCATGYNMNSTTGLCDSIPVSVGAPLTPTGAYYCVTYSPQVPVPFYSVMPYNGSMSNNSSTRICTLVPPPGFSISTSAGTDTTLNSYQCEDTKTDPTTGVISTFDFLSDTDQTASGPGQAEYTLCHLITTDDTTPSTPTDPGSPPTDGSGNTSGYVADGNNCYTSVDQTDLVAVITCLEA